MNNDTYNNEGQAGSMGPNADVHDNTFQQIVSKGALDLPKLAQELAQLRGAMKEQSAGTAEQDEAIGAVAAGRKSSRTGRREPGAAAAQSCWELEAAEAIKRAM